MTTSCLVVEPDAPVRHLLVRLLGRRGYATAEHHDLGTALDAIAAERPDVVVLGLPAGPEIEALLAIRRDEELGAVLVLATVVEPDPLAIAEALENGADDCMAKPLSPRELLARIEALVRRSRPRSVAVELDGLSVDPRSRIVKVDGRAVDLPRREFDLLALLARRAGEVVRREDIMRELWPDSVRWQPEESLTEHIHRLRRRIEADPGTPRRLETIRGVGYRLNP